MIGGGYVVVVLIMFSRASLISGEKHCCPFKTVGGHSSLAGVYTLKEERAAGSKMDEDCMDTCVYTRRGEEFCFGSKPDYPVKCSTEVKSLWVGPGTGGSDRRSEVLTLPGLHPSQNCQVPPYPNKTIQGTVAQIIGDFLHVCGGLVSSGTSHGGSSTSTILAECYWTTGQPLGVKYPWGPAKPMIEHRWGAASVQRDDGSFWVTGGWGGNTSSIKDALILKSTEVWKGGNWKNYTDLPEALEFHCMVQINATHTFFSGGWTDTGGPYGSVTSATWIYGDGNFSKQEDMPIPKRGRFSHSCARAAFKNQIWVVGGQENFSNQLNSTLIFDLSTKNWTKGPDLPVNTTGGQLVQTEDTLLFIGGVIGTGNQKTQTKNIYKLVDSDRMWNPLAWILAGKMETTRAHFNALVWEGCNQ